MLDLKWIRENPEELDKGLANRGAAPLAQEIIDIDREHRQVTTDLQTLLSARNQIAKDIGLLKSKGENADELLLKSNQVKENIPLLEEKEKQLKLSLDSILERIPNIPQESVPFGPDETGNVCIKTEGTPKIFDFEPLSHDALGEQLGMMSFEDAAKMSGARFVVLKKSLARLERALASFMLDVQTQENGYSEVSPPTLVKSEALFGTGQLPKMQEDLFETTSGYYLIPTSEVSLTNLVRESILDESALPLRLTANTLCFRQEAGAAGRDTRGMIRQHQFYKVEMVCISKPEDSEKEHLHMLKSAESILQKLELPYKVMVLCTGDMSFTSTKTYDIDVWLPSQNTYREISSCSNCFDFQARRMNARYRQSSENSKPQFVHTLNGSGLAVGRALVAVMENYQQPDGSIIIPEVLRAYMNGLEVIK